MVLNNASVFFKGCLLLLPVAVLVQLIAISTSYWVTKEDEFTSQNIGIWEFCANDLKDEKSKLTCYDEYSPGTFVLRGFILVTRAFAILGTLALLTSLVLTLLCAFHFEKAERKIVFILNVIFTFVSAGCILLSVVVFASKLPNYFPSYKAKDLDWSFHLSVTGGAVSLVGAVLLTVDLIKFPTSSSS